MEIGGKSWISPVIIRWTSFGGVSEASEAVALHYKGRGGDGGDKSGFRDRYRFLDSGIVSSV